MGTKHLAHRAGKRELFFLRGFKTSRTHCIGPERLFHLHFPVEKAEQKVGKQLLQGRAAHWAAEVVWNPGPLIPRAASCTMF